MGMGRCVLPAAVQVLDQGQDPARRRQPDQGQQCRLVVLGEEGNDGVTIDDAESG
jgi:hypothetical protein